MFIDAFYSDPHFGHAQIIKYCNRPFADVAEMTEVLIDNYNDRIPYSGATVVWLGDCFFMPPPEAAAVLRRMNGYKILLLGNHGRSDASMAQLGFDLVLREATTVIAGTVCRLSHYPYAGGSQYERGDDSKVRRPLKRPGEVLLHGHTHRSAAVKDRCIDVGVDAWKYGPAMASDISALIRWVLK